MAYGGCYGSADAHGNTLTKNCKDVAQDFFSNVPTKYVVSYDSIHGFVFNTKFFERIFQLKLDNLKELLRECPFNKTDELFTNMANRLTHHGFTNENERNIFFYICSKVFPRSFLKTFRVNYGCDGEAQELYTLFHHIFHSYIGASPAFMRKCFDLFDDADFDYTVPDCHQSIITDAINARDTYSLNELKKRRIVFSKNDYDTLAEFIKRHVCPLRTKIDTNKFGFGRETPFYEKVYESVELLTHFFAGDMIHQVDTCPPCAVIWPDPKSDADNELLSYAKTLFVSAENEPFYDIGTKNLRSRLVRPLTNLQQQYEFIVSCIKTFNLETTLISETYLHGSRPIEILNSDMHTKFVELFLPTTYHLTPIEV